MCILESEFLQAHGVSLYLLIHFSEQKFSSYYRWKLEDIPSVSPSPSPSPKGKGK